MKGAVGASMPRHGRSKADRRHEEFEWRKRDEEYRALARELHKEWCERLDDEADVSDDFESAEDE
jgi:hypothetical protein